MLSRHPHPINSRRDDILLACKGKYNTYAPPRRDANGTTTLAVDYPRLLQIVVGYHHPTGNVAVPVLYADVALVMCHVAMPLLLAQAGEGIERHAEYMCRLMLDIEREYDTHQPHAVNVVKTLSTYLRHLVVKDDTIDIGMVTTPDPGLMRHIASITCPQVVGLAPLSSSPPPPGETHAT